MTFCLCSGGIGDLLLGIAESFHREKCLLIHAANRYNAGMMEDICEAFGVPSLVLDGSFSQDLKPLWRHFSTHPGCISTCHLPQDMDFVAWRDAERYARKIAATLPGVELFGKEETDIPWVVIQPAGSNLPAKISTPHGEVTKDRQLSKVELAAVVAKYLPGHRIWLVGSELDIQRYGIIRQPNVSWINSAGMTDHEGRFVPGSWSRLFRVINSCSLAVSTDTWLKTYAAMVGIPTIVIRTRYDGGYFDGSPCDLSENIFLSRRLFPLLELRKVEDLIGRDSPLVHHEQPVHGQHAVKTRKVITPQDRASLNLLNEDVRHSLDIHV